MQNKSWQSKALLLLVINQECCRKMDCTSKCRNFNHAADVVLSAITRENLTSFQTICQRICVNFPFVVDAYGRSPLHVAASCGKHDIVEWLVKEQRVDIGIRDKESNWTPLHRSLFYGQLHCSVKLLQASDCLTCAEASLFFSFFFTPCIYLTQLMCH